MLANESKKRIGVMDVRVFVLAVLKAVNVRENIARLVTEGLLSASIRGDDSHGVRLLPHYIAAVEASRINPDPK